MGHCFELKHWSVVFKISVRDLQSSDKPDLKEDKAAIKPEVPQSSPKWLMLVCVFFFHSCFQNTPHHSHIQTGGEHRESIFRLWCVHMLCLIPLSVTPWTLAGQAPLSKGFPRQEYWNGVAISYSRGFSQPRDWTCVCLAGGFTTETPAKPMC